MSGVDCTLWADSSLLCMPSLLPLFYIMGSRLGVFPEMQNIIEQSVLGIVLLAQFLNC